MRVGREENIALVNVGPNTGGSVGRGSLVVVAEAPLVMLPQTKLTTPLADHVGHPATGILGINGDADAMCAAKPITNINVSGLELRGLAVGSPLHVKLSGYVATGAMR